MHQPVTEAGHRVRTSRRPVSARQTVTIAVSDTQSIELDDQEVRMMRRATTLPVRNIKADRPWTVPSKTSSISWHTTGER